ncbi:hypothetical protein BG707_04300 [Staphylococcus aureus]|uniref:hypothetical protein n=1 Tax=Staphylococcus aureus TaxID=1280 RepID=UPI000B9A4494|nr:hypothetical protein [Staphylococcus aureus]OZH48665.1 hypothetical protein BG707_04300 [Staphylococcus aureus]
MKFKTTKGCKSNNIFKRSQEINNRESEKGCLWGISMLILLFLLILFGITACSSSIHFIN